MTLPRYLPILGCLLATQPASAIPIDYSVVALGGNSFRYNYTIANDGSLGAGVPVQLFDIIFDSALYDETSLNIVTADPPASDWDEAILATGFLVGPAYDALALAGGIADGDSVSGFAVEFTWIGAGMPGSQPFEVYDPDTFDLLDQGTTRLANANMPEPSTLALLLLPAIAAGALRWRRR